MSNKTGGPAFPQQFQGTTEPSLSGLSIRDYFAARALQGFCSRSESDKWTPDEMATDSYALADAMLKAREAT